MKCTVPHLSHRMPKWIAMVGNYGIKGTRNARLFGRRVTVETKRDFQNASRSSQPDRTLFLDYRAASPTLSDVLRGWWCRVGVRRSVVVACLQEEADTSVKL